MDLAERTRHMADRPASRYSLSDNAEFVITEYNQAKPFASFFPGVAGKNGIPMWTFYVNRGQCICSMGVQDKDHAILEFYPANQAYQMASRMGFRTFVKLTGDTTSFYEPFQNHLQDKSIKRRQEMRISHSRLTLEEINESLGLSFLVEYCNVPNDTYAGLIRKLHIRNDSDQDITIECLDGLPLVVPFGVDNASLKMTRRLVEAFVEVDNLEAGAPMFRGKVEPVDRPEVVRIEAGHFYLGFMVYDKNSQRVAPVVDPVKVFGTQTDYSYPEGFLSESGETILQGQILENRYPCAMGLFETILPVGGRCTYTSIVGQVSSREALNELVPRISQPGYVAEKFVEDAAILGELLRGGFLCSEDSVLDQYAQQNYLDNGLRGGFPLTLSGGENSTAFYLYSRKHGDLERDYNHFSLSPTNYSQGNANYRDVNQNRRNDLFFNPQIHTANVELFYNLIQLDGFNPLVIKDVYFKVRSRDDLSSLLPSHFPPEAVKSVAAFLEKPFTPGLLMGQLHNLKLKLLSDSEAFIGSLLEICDRSVETEHGEGFWTDHWIYNLDLLENYLAVYPDQASDILFESKVFTFYDNAHRVRPRADKYVLWDGVPMQLEAVVYDEEKAALINQRTSQKHVVRTDFGRGDIYQTTLVNKIISLITLKMASLDPEGVGVEMEADKPNWYDALNGLPGILGSSLNETLEIKRNILFLKKIFTTLSVQGRSLFIYEELAELIRALESLLAQQLTAFDFWDQASKAKERYRSVTRLGISGNEKERDVASMETYFDACLEKLEKGIKKAWDSESGIPYSYFINSVTSYHLIEQEDGTQKVNGRDLPCFQAEAFHQKQLPLFLEGPVHYLRTCTDKQEALRLAQQIRSSTLFDQKLKMYKVNAPLTDQPMEIGRARVFSPGWFENESIWLHMEYKYVLELLRNELYEDFYSDFKNVMVPFFDPKKYGRSILENASFIVSSANPDSSIHGNGYVARLSGATAEFMNMLLLMCIGPNPFRLDQDNQLVLEFKPALPKWLFTGQGKNEQIYRDGAFRQTQFPADSFSFMFLGDILVTYLNPNRKNTFGKDAVAPTSWKLIDESGQEYICNRKILPTELSVKVRNKEISKIEIDLS
ncbi:MAG: hypothetical protein P8Y84_03065 [Desulfuromonadales bacterium]